MTAGVPLLRFSRRFYAVSTRQTSFSAKIWFQFSQEFILHAKFLYLAGQIDGEWRILIWARSFAVGRRDHRPFFMFGGIVIL